MPHRLDLEDFRIRVTEALEGMESEEFRGLLTELGEQMPSHLSNQLGMEHSSPSPSGLTTCQTQLWYKAHSAPAESRIPAAWLKRAAVGSMTELLWMALFRHAGYAVDLGEKLQCGPYMSGHNDGFIYSQPLDENGDGNGGTTGLLELKDLTGWTYKRILEEPGGIRNSEMRYYTQIQMYMYGADVDWGLFFVSPADPAPLQSNMRRYKKYGQDWTLPLFYTEIVERDEAHIQASLNRAESIATLMKEITPPPREYDGVINWPCGYCPFQRRCNDEFAGG